MNRIIFDIKAHSSVSIKECGEAAFAQHPDTEIVCITLKEPYTPPDFWLPESLRNDDYSGLSDTKLIRMLYSNHLAAFDVETEMYLWKYKLNTYLPDLDFPGPDYFDPISVRAIRAGLPGSEEELCKIFAIDSRNDWKNKNYLRTVLKNTRQFDRLEKRHLAIFLKHSFYSVALEEALAFAIPEMPPEEYKFWKKSWQINDRGFYISKKMFTAHLQKINQEQNEKYQQLAAIAGSSVAKDNRALLHFFNNQGANLNTLSDADLAFSISIQADGILKEALRLKKDLVSAKLPELEKIQNMICKDNRIRGAQQFYHSFTGNWKDRLTELDKSNFISCPKEKTLWELSLPDIEFRIADWLAGEKAIDSGKYFSPMKKYLLQKKYASYSTTAATANVLDRLCLYETPIRQIVTVPQICSLPNPAETAAKIVQKWQRQHPKLKKYQENIFQKTVNAVKTDLCEIYYGKLNFVVMGNYLLITLPSGHQLHYYNPCLVLDDDLRQQRFQLVVSGVISRKWKKRKIFGGTLLKDIISAVKSDLLMYYIEEAEKRNLAVVRIRKDSLILEAEKNIPKPPAFHLPLWAMGMPVYVQCNSIK